MNAKLNNEIAALIEEHKWQELLRKIPTNEPIPLTFRTVKEINNLRSVAARLNTMGEDENRYSFSGLNYNTKCICVTAKPKNNDQIIAD